MKSMINKTIKEIIHFYKEKSRKCMDKFDEILRNILNLQDMKLICYNQ